MWILFAFSFSFFSTGLLFLWMKNKNLESMIPKLEEKIEFLEKELKVEAVEWDKENFREPEMFVSISIPDPLSLAKQRSSLAKYVGHMMPLTLKRKVYEEVMKESIKELEKQKVDGDVRIRYL